MIPHGVEVFVGLVPVDLRWGFDRLAGLVEAQMARNARSGALFVFFGKRRTAMKVLFFEGSGLCQFYKRLDRGLLRLPVPPDADATSMVLEERALDELLDGIDIEPRTARTKPRSPRLH